MANIPFSIDGNEIRCPQFSCEPGALVYAYQNGSQCFIGAPQVTCTWQEVTDDEAALIWGIYYNLVTGGDIAATVDVSVDVTVPDFANNGLRATKAYMTRPTGTAVGDGTKNLMVILYNLHADSMVDAYNAPQGNLWETINNGQTVTVGTSEYSDNDWQF